MSTTIFDTMHETLTVSSTREVAAVTAAWESDPTRWQQDPTQWPELLGTGLDSEQYVSHLLQDPADLIEAATLARLGLFTPRMRTLLVRLHRVLIRDADSGALSVAMLDGVDPSEPGAVVPTHVEQAGRPVMVSTDRELLERRAWLTTADWDQLAVVWAKLSAMVQTVTVFLASQGPLTETETRTARMIERQATMTLGVVEQLRAAGVDRIADLPQQ